MSTSNSIATKNGTFQMQGIDWNDYNYMLYSNTISRSQILSFMQSISANTISLDTFYQLNSATSGIAIAAPGSYVYTQPQSTIISTGNFFKNNGMDVNYRVHIALPGINTSETTTSLINSGKFNANTFFNDYTAILTQEAKTAQAMGAKVFCIGVELGQVTSMYGDLWAKAIDAVRANFTGAVTYACNFNMNSPNDIGKPGVYNRANEAPTLSFGNLLDYIGLDIYSGLPLNANGKLATGTATVQQAINALDNPGQLGYSVIDQIRQISNQYNKKIIFLEGGWNSTDIQNQGASTGPPNQLNQANLWAGEFQAYATYLKDILIGYNGMGEFPANNTSVKYLDVSGSIQGKLAQNVFADWYSGKALNNNFIINLTSTTKKGFGFAGNDTFTVQSGSHIIDGGGGINTAVFSKTSNNFNLTASSGTSSWSIVDKTGALGSSTATNIQRLQFSDANIALDVAHTQTAGSGYMLYKAAFNRTPDVGGLGFWINQMDTGMSYSDVANNFVNSAEFKNAFGGSNPSVNTLVTKLYTMCLIERQTLVD